MNGSVNQEDLIMSINKIKSYIDNNVIELKVSDDGTKIYYKTLSEQDNWLLLLDVANFTIGDVKKVQQITLRKGTQYIEWKYDNDPTWKQLVKLDELRGRTGVTFKPKVSDDGILSWTNDGYLTNPTPIMIKGEAKLPDDIEVITHDVGCIGIPNANVYFNEDKSKMFFEFDLPRGRDGNMRTSFYQDLLTESKDVINAINELVNRIVKLETEINELKNN